MSDSEDREITLGVGKLVGLFFLVVLLCAVSFGFGYGFGRNSGSRPILDSVQAIVKTSPKQQPTASAPACPAGENCQQPGVPSSQDLSFYKAVEQKDAPAELSPPPAPAPVRPAAPQPPAPPRAVPESNPTISTGLMVQVAAVSKREDAEVLQDALRRKQYPVLIVTAPTDRLFHVQVGPFGDPKEAETMRARLQGDGYNPILKR